MEEVRRIEAEREIRRQLEEAGIVSELYERGTAAVSGYDGPSLQSLVSDGPMPPEEPHR